MTEQPDSATGNVMFDLSPHLRVNVWLTGDVALDAMRLAETAQAVRAWLADDERARTLLMPPPPQPGQAPQRQQQRPQQARTQSPGTGYFCPDHNVEVRKTDAKYDRDGDRYYHPLPEHEWYQLDDGRTAKNHNLYLRQLVDSQGNSVEVAPPDDDGFPPF